MAWTLLGQVPIGYQWARFGPLITGDAILKLEHTTSYESFPGKAYALLGCWFPAADIRGLYHRSYPYGPHADLVISTVPQAMVNAGLDARYLELKHDLWARIQADANWEVNVYQWSQ